METTWGLNLLRSRRAIKRYNTISAPPPVRAVMRQNTDIRLSSRSLVECVLSIITEPNRRYVAFSQPSGVYVKKTLSTSVLGKMCSLTRSLCTGHSRWETSCSSDQTWKWLKCKDSGHSRASDLDHESQAQSLLSFTHSTSKNRRQ